MGRRLLPLENAPVSDPNWKTRVNDILRKTLPTP